MDLGELVGIGQVGGTWPRKICGQSKEDTSATYMKIPLNTEKETQCPATKEQKPDGKRYKAEESVGLCVMCIVPSVSWRITHPLELDRQ